jgi:hypothetical protein
MQAQRMQAQRSAVCPECGNSETEKISECQTVVRDGIFSSPGKPHLEVSSAYRCSCGRVFTQIVKEGRPQEHAVEAPDAATNGALFAMALRIQTRIGGMVDNPNYQIVGFEGEACIAEIREVAAHCEAQGLMETAERLNQLGRDVMRRWAG